MRFPNSKLYPCLPKWVSNSQASQTMILLGNCYDGWSNTPLACYLTWIFIKNWHGIMTHDITIFNKSFQGVSASSHICTLSHTPFSSFPLYAFFPFFFSSIFSHSWIFWLFFSSPSWCQTISLTVTRTYGDGYNQGQCRGYSFKCHYIDEIIPFILIVAKC